MTRLKQKRQGIGGRIADGVILLLFLLLCLTMIIPFWNTFVSSFSTEAENIEQGFRLFPRTWSITGYQAIVEQGKLLPAFMINVYVTVLGTLGHLIFCSMAGYALSRGYFPGKNFITNLLIITMVVPGQITMVPTFVLYRSLGLLNNVNVMVISAMISTFGILLMRNFFLAIPASMHDSAVIDGAGEVRIAFSIYLPLIKPGLATVALYQLVAKWNVFLKGFCT